jgi:ParB family transcriptional regulator, chromosome partitioning protein
MSEKKALGRGLSALLSDVDLGEPQRNDRAEPGNPANQGTSQPIERLRPNTNQPRQQFNDEAMQELTQSIREHGILQPLIVRPDPEQPGHFQIVAGERRWRAAQAAQLHEVPVLVRDFSDAEMLQVAIIENIQRADLNAVEEALGYRALMTNFGHTQEKLAEALGKSRSHIANLLRILTLPEKVLDYVRQGKLTAGHARACVSCENPIALAEAILHRGLSVRAAEKLAQNAPIGDAPKPVPRKGEKDADTKSLENDLSLQFGMKVSIDHNASTKGGELRIHYRNLDDLDRVIQILVANLG